MKRYLLFGGEQYYPHGGWCDFKGSFDTEQEACDAIGKIAMVSNIDWYHIIDSRDGSWAVSS